MNIAILGAGFIGLNFTKYLINQTDIKLIVIDKNDPPPFLPQNFCWKKASALDSSILNDYLIDIDVLYYMIPQINFDLNILNNSILEFSNLLDVSIKKKIKRFVFMSSAAVYGNQEILPIKEDAETNPISGYGFYKLIFEKMLYVYKYQHKLEFKVIRLSNPYGPGQKLYGSQGIIAIMIGKLLKNEKIVINGDGTSLRDFIYIDDLCEALYLVGTTHSNFDIFNIGSGKANSINEVINYFSAILDKKINIEYTCLIRPEISKSQLSLYRANKFLHFKPKISLKNGILNTLKFHLNS